MKKNIVLVLLLLSAVAGHTQGKKAVTITFWVGGSCEMCEARIEKALDVKGVKLADYDLASHMLTVTFIPSKISEERLHQLINEVGHDTERSAASDESYDQIHGCCKYRTHDHHGGEHDHQEDVP